ncbi:MAG: hypothetical protein ACJAWW_001904 [Sulfurimonas sp.]|jgi:hypothetical protein
MNKILRNMAFSAILLTSSLYAELGFSSLKGLISTANLTPIIGLEAGQSNIDYKIIESGLATYEDTAELNHIGLKLGTETTHYRIFLSSRIFDSDQFDYARTYGMELQYLFNLSNRVNMFIGVNAGTIDMEFEDDRNTNTITLDNTYYGGDIGFNLHLSDGIDFELGARIMSLNSSESEDVARYDFDNIITSYASIILKFPSN